MAVDREGDKIGGVRTSGYLECVQRSRTWVAARLRGRRGEVHHGPANVSEAEVMGGRKKSTAAVPLVHSCCWEG